jgi:hypothetical protein
MSDTNQNITEGASKAPSVNNPNARPYLAKRIVVIDPTPAAQSWRGILANYSEKTQDAFSYKGVAKSWDVPLKPRSQGGGLVNVLNDQVMKYVGKYNMEMTERQFFEKELGVNLSTSLPDNENFWKTDLAYRHKVKIIAGEQKTLDLKQPLDMLHYKILKANSSTFMEGWDNYNKTRINTVLFVITDVESKRESALIEGDEKAAAWAYYNELSGSKERMIDFFRAKGERKAANSEIKPLKAALLQILNGSAEGYKEMLKVKNDPYFDSKVLLQKLTEVGAIKFSQNQYQTESGEVIGKINDVISWLNNPVNFEAIERMKIHM